MDNLWTKRRQTEDQHSVTVVGLGNTGSHALTPIARLASVARVTLVDFDVCEEKNLQSQSITPADVGKPKVKAHARRLKALRPTLDIQAIAARIEEVPICRLFADLIVAGLDSRVARQRVNQIAWRLGVPWIDAAVDASGMLVRLNSYVPGRDEPCMECAWYGEDYWVLEQIYPCQGAVPRAAPTNATASQGLVAGGLMAVESQKLLAGDFHHSLAGKQSMLDLRHYTHSVTSYRRNPNCLFDHRRWRIELLEETPGSLTLGGALALGAPSTERWADCAIQLEGNRFTRRQFCQQCQQYSQAALRLTRRLTPAQKRCPQCGRDMASRGFDMLDWVEGRSLRPGEWRRRLASIGFQPGDVFTVRGPADERHFALSGGLQRNHSCNSEAPLTTNRV